MTNSEFLNWDISRMSITQARTKIEIQNNTFQYNTLLHDQLFLHTEKEALSMKTVKKVLLLLIKKCMFTTILTLNHVRD